MKNTNLPINLKDNNLLIENDFIMITKAGKLWRCGKGYRKDWDKLIGKLVLLHGQAFILVSRVKQDGKWYLVFKDEKHIYTERQDKALHNKNLAKDTIVEKLVQEVKIPEIKYQLCLPQPVELVDRLVEEMKIKALEHNRKFTYKNGKPMKKCQVIDSPHSDSFIDKIRFIDAVSAKYMNKWFDWNSELRKQVYKKLAREYHPDRTKRDTLNEFNIIQQWLKL